MALNSERLFVDLIFRSSRKYPNWDPEVIVEPGDYGRITQGPNEGFRFAFWRKKAQGTFLKEGNIYEDGLAAKFQIPKPKEHGGEATEGATWITSQNAVEVDVDSSIAVQTPAITQCGIKASYKFSSGRGAVLAMENDIVATISPPGVLRRLFDSTEFQHLVDNNKNIVLISEVHKCSSYARFLSSKAGATITLGLSAEHPVENFGGAKVDAKWVYSKSAGNFKSKTNKDGKRVFYPLFRLVSLKEGQVSTGMRGEMEESIDTPLPDAEPPWVMIEEGDETVSFRNDENESRVEANSGTRNVFSWSKRK